MIWLLPVALLPRPGRHLLDHRQYQLSVTVIQIHGITTDLVQEADFIFGKWRKVLAAAIANMVGKKLAERKVHGAGNFGKRVQRWDGVAVFYARKIAAQKPGALFNVTL